MRRHRDSPFRVKYCGVTRVQDAMDAIEVGADAIGLNFVESSPRRISLGTAKEIRRACGSRCLVVAVVANGSLENAKSVCDSCSADLLQLHGQESPDEFCDLTLPPILKAIPWRGPEDGEFALQWLSARPRLKLAGFLVDAYDPVILGGTGKKARWDLLEPRPHGLGEVPLILAGGLTSKNVEEAIRITDPDGLDVSSGIELSPGIKSKIEMLAFMKAVQESDF